MYVRPLTTKETLNITGPSAGFGPEAFDADAARMKAGTESTLICGKKNAHAQTHNTDQCSTYTTELGVTCMQLARHQLLDRGEIAWQCYFRQGIFSQLAAFVQGEAGIFALEILAQRLASSCRLFTLGDGSAIPSLERQGSSQPYFCQSFWSRRTSSASAPEFSL